MNDSPAPNGQDMPRRFFYYALGYGFLCGVVFGGSVAATIIVGGAP
jgi:hypothetical protein